MTKMNLYPVLLAGGSGTRLWPVSRECYPKQIARFFGDDSLIQHTIKRLFPIFSTDNIRIVCGREHASGIVRDASMIGISLQDRIITEPCGRNTAPAILLSIFNILKTEKDALIFVFPADHIIEDIPAFHESIRAAESLALQNYIVTFGITPAYPETGYGYIEASKIGVQDAFVLKRFVEKPDMETAKSYVTSGKFFWNSGMFAFNASLMLKEFEKFKPEMLAQVQNISEHEIVSADDWRSLENISIDYAVMEKTDRGVVLPSNFGWSDIGSWKSLYDFLPKNEDENVISGDVILHNTKKSFVMGEDRLIAINGLSSIVLVDTPDAVFVSDMENSREVRHIVDRLKENKRKEGILHTTIYHSWGYEKLLEQSPQITVKRFVIYHSSKTGKFENSDRNCKCFVVKGSAKLDIDGSISIVKESESICIQKGYVFSLSNIGEIDLYMIMVS